MKLQTNVSQAFWCSLLDGEAKFEKALVKPIRPDNPALGTAEYKPVAWFDELFRGGILIPEADGKPLTILIAGPPGSGKTTLALELCYRLAKNDAKVPGQPELFTFYISTEAESNRIISNFKSFGYKDAQHFVAEFQNQQPTVPLVSVYGREKLRKSETLAKLVEAALEALAIPFGVAPTPTTSEWIKRLFTPDPSVPGRKSLRPDILVVDSLNIVAPDRQEGFFEEFRDKAPPATKVIILILDSGVADDHKSWEYASDIIIRLSYNLTDYFVRTLEVIKARYQPHVWGKHQLKIYEKPQVPATNDPDRNRKRRRDHPYREEGGVFIFPSIHYYLSRYKREAPFEKQEGADSWNEKFSEFVKFPEGRCTAFIGTRGGHKSHLGYVHLLYRILKKNEAGLIISLRDDENMTRKTMKRILKEEFNAPETALDEFEKNNQLEILYYHPGYITPEEFFHRMFISVHRLKKNRPKVTVLFNSLDQLSARFPLCAKQQIFVPGIIEFLTGEEATSIFIAVNEPGQPGEQYGLLQMADLILSFYPHRFPFEEYYSHLDEELHLEQELQNGTDQKFKERIRKTKETQKGTFRTETVLRVVRFAGGERAGAAGLLELAGDPNNHPHLYKQPGLHFTRLLSSRFNPEDPKPPSNIQSP